MQYGRADFIHAAIAAANGAGIIVEHLEVLLQIVEDLGREFRHAVFLDQRENGGLDRGDLGGELQDDADFAFDFFFFVGINETDEQRAVATGGGFDDVGHEFLARLVIEVAQVLAGGFHVAA